MYFFAPSPPETFGAVSPASAATSRKSTVIGGRPVSTGLIRHAGRRDPIPWYAWRRAPLASSRTRPSATRDDGHPGMARVRPPWRLGRTQVRLREGQGAHALAGGREDRVANGGDHGRQRR